MVEKAPLGELLIGIIDHPGRTLANVVAYRRWRWLLPAIIAIAALAVSLALTAPLLAAQTQQVMAQQLSRMSPSQAEQVQRQMATLQSPLFMAGTAFVTGAIGLVIGWLLGAAILYFGDLVAGGELEFTRVFAAMPWLYVPFSIETLLQGIWAATRGKLIVNQGLSYLVSSGNALQDARNPGYVALGQVTLFRLWHLILVYAFFRVAGRLGRGTSLSLTAAYTLLVLGGQLALTALAGVVSPG